MGGIFRLGVCLLFLGSSAARAERFSAELENVISDCVRRVDHPEYGAFQGCWDWHSAVHAHWALFRLALDRGVDSDATRWAETSLSPERLAIERALLEADRDFEMPYGRAWFLRLALDFERWAGARGVAEPGRLRPIADRIVADLLEYFGRVRPDPGSREYDNASWAVFQLHAWLAHTGEDRSAVQELIESHFLVRRPDLSFAGDREDFFSRYGNWAYLVAETQPEGTLAGFLEENPISAEALDVPDVTSDHSFGLVWSRAWAMRSLRDRVTDPALRDRLTRAYDAHVRRGMKNHREFKHDYKRYGHWVSQFAVYALAR